ncbi:MAG: YbaK/EbsC family protein [Anaerolineales bacterium]|nr:YbaK/EbsC family protein [Anaerolineales bacterium]
MADALSRSAKKIQEALKKMGAACEVVELPDSTRTAAEAAQALGCAVAQIAKSIVFRTAESGKPVMVIASGANRVNEKKIAELLGEAVEKADPDFVRETTGFSIGGVPPVGHAVPIPVFLDEDLLKHESIWAAAGTPRSVLKTTGENLAKLTRGKVTSVK